ncbi:MAG TPA: hypothetical protein VKU82_04810 [Planctomycetaceae bacterium]|nr:hypothetical protein [Planctomycetaceae bacterium]
MRRDVKSCALILIPALLLLACSGWNILLSLQLANAGEPESDVEKQEAVARKERYTNWMRSFAEETAIRLPAADNETEERAQLVPNPVFRYSDEERFIPDATLWVWTRDSRPVAFQKVEGNNHGGGQAWTICFASLSEGLVDVRWRGGRRYAARTPGVKFKPIPKADAPAENARLRIVQIKTLKDRFTGRLGVDAEGKGGAETRIIAKPIFEYADPKSKLPMGAIFGMSSTGTNPDLLLLIEARPDGTGGLRWEYAHARMTSASLIVRLDDAEIWSEMGVSSRDFDNWTFHFLRRDFP